MFKIRDKKKHFICFFTVTCYLFKIDTTLSVLGRLYLLIARYQREFPHGNVFEDVIPTPIACQYGRMDDVELFVSLHPFHKYITNRGVNGYRDDMTLKEMANKFGRNSYG